MSVAEYPFLPLLGYLSFNATRFGPYSATFHKRN